MTSDADVQRSIAMLTHSVQQRCWRTVFSGGAVSGVVVIRTDTLVTLLVTWRRQRLSLELVIVSWHFSLTHSASYNSVKCFWSSFREQFGGAYIQWRSKTFGPRFLFFSLRFSINTYNSMSSGAEFVFNPTFVLIMDLKSNTIFFRFSLLEFEQL